MSEYSAGGLTGAGSATLPLCALVGGAANRIKVHEIGMFNTTTTAFAARLARFTTAGTPGAAMSTANNETDPEETVTPTGALKNTYSGTAPTLIDAGRRFQFAGAVGSGVVLTFPKGIIIPAVAANSLGIVTESGTGAALEVYFVWEE